jgi:hypothetical protein
VLGHGAILRQGLRRRITRFGGCRPWRPCASKPAVGRSFDPADVPPAWSQPVGIKVARPVAASHRLREEAEQFARRIIDGIAAISDSTFFTENARFVISNLNTWGWIILLLGGTQVLAAFGSWARTPGVRWFGVAVAALNGIAQLLFIPAYPFWSLALFTLDILVIYGLIAHGARSSIA